MGAKLKDIAEEAGVSIATVSFALNDKKGVSPQKRKRIIEIARNMGYPLDESKKGDKTKESEDKAVRFIIYKRHGSVVSDTPFFANLIEGIQKECKKDGFELLISHINKHEENYLELIKEINQGSCSGIILLATEMLEEDLKLFNDIEKPVVILDSYFQHQEYDFVLINNREGSYRGTICLVENGHKNIGYLHSSVYINNFYYRKQGFLKALEEKDINFNPKNEFKLEPTLEGSYNDMKEILSHKNKTRLPSAFFADNDIIAFGAIKALKEKGFKIPEDISIVGFDDMPYCKISNPEMSTIRVYKNQLGTLAVKRLMEKIRENKEIRLKIELGTELIHRDSVK
ncbi:MAG: LacI family DNA-binding transcriptional regulator, partial [Bacillota bacterium]